MIVVIRVTKSEFSAIFMIKIKHILFLIVSLCVVLTTHSQTNALPDRSPEQEALKQTEKQQIELELTSEQAKLMYEINLRYERQRQVSNTRTEAMERIKNKNAEIEKILSAEQNNRLQNKRYERSSFETSSSSGNQSTNSSNNRSSLKYVPNQSSRVQTTDIELRSTYRSSNYQTNNGTPTPNITAPQTVRRSAPSQSVTRSSQSTIPTPSFRPQSSPPASVRSAAPASNSSRK